MLAVAGRRVAETRLRNVAALHEMDAEATNFPEASFDTAVAMFVASVVPHPKQLLAEMRRVVRPGGNILFVTHIAADRGPRWWIERTLAPASRALGWHPDFSLEAMCSAEDLVRSLHELPVFLPASSLWCGWGTEGADGVDARLHRPTSPDLTFP